MSAAGKALSIRGATKLYGAARAIDQVSLDVAPGEFVTLLGPSGSGKTTVLMAVAGFVPLDEGDVLLDGRSVIAAPPYRRNLGVVFQQYALFPHLTVQDNVAYPLSVRRVAKAKARAAVDEALALVKLAGLERRYPRELSGGQQQRVALARALVFRPPVLLMDEPLSALDRKLRAAMQLEIRAIQQQLSITTLYVTHDQEEALTMSDRVAVMRDGRIVQGASPAELYERPADEFVAGFLGDTNLLRGQVVAAVDGVCTIRTSGGLDFVARRDGRFDIGDVVLASLRPERVTIGEANKLADARVRQAVYLGASMRLALETSGETIIASIAGQPMAAMPKAGDIVSVGWDAGAPVLLRPSAGRTGER